MIEYIVLKYSYEDAVLIVFMSLLLSRYVCNSLRKYTVNKTHSRAVQCDIHVAHAMKKSVCAMNTFTTAACVQYSFTCV